MDVYEEAVFYLEAHHIPMEADTDVLEEDVFQEEAGSCLLSPLNPELPHTPTILSLEEMLERRLAVLQGILESEEVYLRELDVLLTPLKALWASAGTSQPVLSSQQLQTVFYQLPELRDAHRSFYRDLKERLSANVSPDVKDPELTVGDLFLKMVNHIGLYGGYIQNYEKAVEIVRKCTNSDPRFRTLAESMTSNNGAEKSRTKYTFEALLYKPLDRVTKTTLVLHDLLKTTPEDHRDFVALQETLRLSRSFLSGLNESSQCKREVTLSHGMRRKLMRDGFVVDACDGERSLRHLFLYTDLLLCTKVKHAAGRGKSDQYRFCWFLPLAGLRLRWFSGPDPTADASGRLHSTRSKMFLLRQQLLQHPKGSRFVVLEARNRRKLEHMDLTLITLSADHRLELHSLSGKSHTLLFSSLYELEEWREAILKLTTHNIETVPPDLLTLTSSCLKLRMTQQPPVHHPGEDEESLCGTLSVAIHSAFGLQQPACVYVCVEVDGFEFYSNRAQTHSSVNSVSPHWDQELSFQVDGAQTLRLVCVAQSDQQDDVILGKTTLKLECESLNKRWRRQTSPLGSVEVTFSLRFCPHPLEPPTSNIQHAPVFNVPIETVAQQEGVLVPHVVRCCVEEVERRGMCEVGIYRVSGAATDVGSLKAAFNSNLREAVTRMRSAEVNVVSGVLKLYFRELPEPLIPPDVFPSLAQSLDIQDLDSRLVCMLNLLQSCPEPNRQTFFYLLGHLRRISQKQDENKMTLLNLATVFGPSLLRPPVAGLGHNAPTMDVSQEVVIQVQVIFSFLQCDNLPEAQISALRDSEDETTHM